MNDIQRFEYEGQQLRTADLNGAPAIVLADIAKILGYRDASNASRVLRDHHKGYSEVSTPSGPQRMLVVTEQGFNRLVIRSNASNAEAVQDWLTDDVLPSIRRTGSYGTPAAIEVPQTLPEALRLAADLAEERDAARAKVTELTPRAEAFDGFLSAVGDYSVNESAKLLCRRGVATGERRLRTWMEMHAWIYRDAGIPRAYQRRVDQGHLVERTSWYSHPITGERMAATPQVRVTPRGLDILAQALAPSPALAEVVA